MGQVWFGNKCKFQTLPTFVYNQKLKPLPIKTVPGRKKCERASLALYKINVKELKKADMAKLLYGYQTKEFTRMLCPKI